MLRPICNKIITVISIPKKVNQRRDKRTDEQKKQFDSKTSIGRNKSEKHEKQWQSLTLYNFSLQTEAQSAVA